MGDVNDDRLLVLRGAIDKVNANTKKPTFKLITFGSSPFTDTQHERDFLMDSLLFELRDVAEKHEIEVIIVDLRTGVRDESTLDQETWIVCSDMLNYCKKESSGIFFFSLQGNKYGYTPLAKSILKEDLDDHLSKKNCSDEQKEIVFKWYILDTNAVPHAYVLRNLESTGDKTYWDDYKIIFPLLCDVVFDKERYADALRIGDSVTSYEYRAAFSNYPVDLLYRKSEAYSWHHRLLSEECIEDKNFCDTNDNNVLQDKMLKMKTDMHQSFDSATVHEASVSLESLKAGPGDVGFDDYMKTFQNFASKIFNESLQSNISMKKEWDLNGCGFGLQGEYLGEILHHSSWANEKLKTFVKREDLVRQVCNLVMAENREDGTGNIPFVGLSGCVMGVSGAGKTALMAKVAHEIYQREDNQNPVLIRFCGTSKGSYNARSLMISLCVQMEHLFDYAMSERKAVLLGAGKYDELVEYFQNLLSTHPVTLFIDSLDQLSNEDQGRSEISFLKHVKPHKDTRIVVSSLPDDDEDSSSVSSKKYVYYLI